MDEELSLVTSLYSLEGQKYVEQVNNEGKDGYLDHIHNITSAMDDYVNSIADGKFRWLSVNSCSLVRRSFEELAELTPRSINVKMRKNY